jgi:hypothetical protein
MGNKGLRELQIWYPGTWQMIYEEIFKEFELRGVRYLVVRGMAVNLYGYIRLTMYLDIMVDLSDKNLSKVVDATEKFGYTPRVPVNPHEFT